MEGWWAAGLVVAHLPADWVTSRLALWPGGPQWGAGLYSRPTLDVAIEVALVAAGWVVYRRSLPALTQRRPLVWTPLVVLLMLQVVWAAMLWL